MSIMRLFERIFESAAETDRIAREERQDVHGPLQPQGEPPTYRCRSCGLLAAERAYCPVCLADTMVLVDAPAPGRRSNKPPAPG